MQVHSTTEHVVHTCPDWVIPVVVLALFAVVALMGLAAYRAAVTS